MPSLGSSESSIGIPYAQEVNQEVPTTDTDQGFSESPSTPGSELEKAVPPPPKVPH